MTLPFKVFIPARYDSSRLPGKPLLEIGGKSLIQHAYEAAAGSEARGVVIVTDDMRIRREAEAFGAAVVMTSKEHVSGTERIGEAVSRAGEDDDTVIVNVQGDEFALPPRLIDQVAKALHDDNGVAAATLCERITTTEEWHDPDVVKVVADERHRALYFSRAPIPWRTEGPVRERLVPPCRHIGLYAYRAGFLKDYARLAPCGPEISERLEQLRILYHGYAIRVEEACAPAGIGVDTEVDLERARTQSQVISHK